MVPRSYNNVFAVIALLMTVGFAYVFDIRRFRFIMAVVLGFFPAAMILAPLARRMFPPKLICSDDVQTESDR